MTDIHSHVVWGVDDGATSVEQSLEMLVTAARAGTKDIVATPHSNREYVFQREVVLSRIEELAAATSGVPKIHFGCEFHLSFDNVDLLENVRDYTINRTQYLLVECPDSYIGPHTEKVLRRMLDEGIVPIIAHPERNVLLREKSSRIESWVELGCLVQVTASSLTGGFGGSARMASRRLMDRGLVHLVASDAHDLMNRHPDLEPARRAVATGWGEDAADILFGENPDAVVEGTPIPGGKQIAWRREARWYQFWKSRAS